MLPEGPESKLVSSNVSSRSDENKSAYKDRKVPNDIGSLYLDKNNSASQNEQLCIDSKGQVPSNRVVSNHHERSVFEDKKCVKKVDAKIYTNKQRILKPDQFRRSQ